VIVHGFALQIGEAEIVVTVKNEKPSRVAWISTQSAEEQQTPRNNPAECDQVLLTRMGLRVPANMTFDSWERAGCQLASIVDSSLWCLGDWLVYGKQHYADRYQWGVRAAGLQYQTLRNYAWVSRRFELRRRRPRLSFQHHAEVASLPLDEQDRWLDRAEREMWSTKQLRIHIRDEHIDAAAKEMLALVIPRIQVAAGQLVRWRQAAEKSGVELDNWVVAALDWAAEQTLGEQRCRRFTLARASLLQGLLRTALQLVSGWRGMHIEVDSPEVAFQVRFI
jgi:hypothetical protein